eukprot:3904739-Amphidinium_carterae.1
MQKLHSQCLLDTTLKFIWVRTRCNWSFAIWFGFLAPCVPLKAQKIRTKVVHYALNIGQSWRFGTVAG